MRKKEEISISFGTRRIGAGEPVLIIAEIGVNHEGCVDTCGRMVREAARAGAGAVKFQTMDADENYVTGTESHEIFNKCALSPEETARMFDYARGIGVEPFTTAGDFATLDWVDRLEPAAHKISSGLLTHLPVIRYAARTGRTLLMSTGLAMVDEIDDAVSVARAEGAGGIGLFQCTSIYPALPKTLNLRAIDWLSHRYNLPAGFSDHSLGCEAATLSAAAGATMIEKHFSLDSSRPGFDHRISVEPEGLKELVARVRAAETMMGEAAANLTDAERENRVKYQRCLVARRPIGCGERFDPTNLGVKRPLPDRRGLPPSRYDDVLGQRARRDLAENEPIVADAVEGVE